MAKRKGTSAPSWSQARKKSENDTRQVENDQRLGKLPPEVWEKILDELDENDLFPLALSCRFFRQKQKELVARTRQKKNGSKRRKPRLVLKTTLRCECEKGRFPKEGQHASAEYLRFVRQEMKSRGYGQKIIMYLAAYHGHLPLLQELLKPSMELDRGSAREAGESSIIQDFKLDGELFTSACKGGQLEVLRWLRSVGCPWGTRASSEAVCSGHFEVLKWLRSEGCPLDSLTSSSAAVGGHLEVLKWLRSEGCPWDWRTSWMAAVWGHLDVLRYAHENGCPWEEYTCTKIAECGQLDALKYAHENGYPWNETVCEEAAKRGDLDMLKYLHENGCPWDEWTCYWAARYGHLDVLKYAHENGCPWNERTWRHASESTREWLEKNGCPSGTRLQ